jgi:hypothetical protein
MCIKKWSYLLIAMCFALTTVSAQSIVLPIDLNKHYIETAKQAYIDSIALHRCDSALDFQDKQIVALDNALSSVGAQLVANTDGLNKANKEVARLEKKVGFWQKVAGILVVITTVLIITK